MAFLAKRAAVVLALVACASAVAARKSPNDGKTLYDVVSKLPEVSKAFAKIEQFGLSKQFKNPKLGITAFIPNNDAFDRITRAIGDNQAILGNGALITQALAYHILNKPLYERNFKKGAASYLTALPGQSIVVQADEKAGVFKVGAYSVVEKDISAGKSVVHVIDGFLVAPALMPSLVKALREAAVAKATVAANTTAVSP